MQSDKAPSISCSTQFSAMLTFLHKKFRRFCSKFRWSIRQSPRPKIIVRRFGRSDLKVQQTKEELNKNGSTATIHSNGQMGGFGSKFGRPIRVATFNAAMFSMAPAIPIVEEKSGFYGNGDVFLNDDDDDDDKDDLKLIRHSMEFDIRAKTIHDRPKSILKQSPLHPNSMADESQDKLMKQQKFARSKLRVSINLPDNEISLGRSRQLSLLEDEKQGHPSKISSRRHKGKAPLRSMSLSLPNNNNKNNSFSGDFESLRNSRTVLEVLREVDADILALQDVKAEEEKGMKPLSDLAGALRMKYVFAESWAPEYGNAVLSKWPIKQWKVQKIFDDTDFRNVLKVTVDVPQVGDINFYCTHLDHLDENWRMKQINAIIQSNEGPHILAGGLNSLDETDYSAERWADIIKYYKEIGKPIPRTEVMRFLKGKQYVDARDFAGECESVVIIAKGQNVQGTCKYGTRVDYILASSNSPYKFVPGSYSVLSSKGTSDHHVVKVDMIKMSNFDQDNVGRRQRHLKKNKSKKKKVIKITNPSSSKGLWRMN